MMTYSYNGDDLVVELFESTIVNINEYGSASRTVFKLKQITRSFSGGKNVIHTLYIPGRLLEMGDLYFRSTREFECIKDFIDSKTIFKPVISL